MLSSHYLADGDQSTTSGISFAGSRDLVRLPGSLSHLKGLTIALIATSARLSIMESLARLGDKSMEDVFLQDYLSSTIAEHATQCQSLFHKYMAMPDIVPDATIIDDQLARFSLWAANMDVYGPLNVSLDYRLRFSPIAADIIHQLLDIICDVLLSCEYFPYHL
jgi:hypothetical protein